MEKSPEQDRCCRAEAPGTLGKHWSFPQLHLTRFPGISNWTKVQLAAGMPQCL